MHIVGFTLVYKQVHWMNPNKEYHDLNPDRSQAAWESILGCMLSKRNWVNQAQLKQPWSFYSVPTCLGEP